MLMLKYDHQLTEVKSRLPQANRILIVISQNLTVDNLAAGLALYLSLKTLGKKVDIVSTGTPLVSHSSLFGIGEVKNDVSRSGAGNFIISLDGVVDNTGTMQQVPALEKLDWYPEGSKLNLVFHVVPGQRFEPTNITSRHEQAGYDLTFVIGCQSLNELGNLFIANSQYFAQGQVVNIDNNPLNSYFGFSNVIDPQASSISEIVAQVLPSLTLNMDKDLASNIISGIYAATNNLTQKVNPDTFLVISQAVQVGGVLPSGSVQAQVQTPVQNPQSQPVFPQADSNAQMITPAQSQPDFQPAAQPVQQMDMNTWQQAPQVNPTPVQDTQYSPPATDNLAANPLQTSPFIVPPQDINIPQSAFQPQPEPQQTQPQFQFSQPSVNAAQPTQPIAEIPQAQAQGFDLRQIFQIPQMPSGAQPANSEPNNIGAQSTNVAGQYAGGNPERQPYEQPPQVAQVSAEERPMGEQAHSPSPEMESPTPDWLVPKIFKGGNLG